jgi:hypothetical protein
MRHFVKKHVVALAIKPLSQPPATKIRGADVTREWNNRFAILPGASVEPFDVPNGDIESKLEKVCRSVANFRPVVGKTPVFNRRFKRLFEPTLE